MRCVAGIDFSLSCPAMCVHLGSTWSPANCQFFYLYSVKKWIRQEANLLSSEFAPYFTIEERLDWITDWFVTHLQMFTKPEVFIENYSYSSHSSSTHILAEGCGLLKHKLWKSHFAIHSLPVTGIKKFATGKGNATKEGMCQSFVNEGLWLNKVIDCPLGKSPLADLADAYYIAKMGFAQ